MPGLRAIIFDLDDTLYPERAYVRSGFSAVAAWAQDRLGLPASEVFGQLDALFRGGTRGHTFDRWLADQGIADHGLVEKMVEVYRKHPPSILPYPDAPGLLGRLRAKYRLGLLSDGYEEVQRGKLKALGIEPAFDAVVFSDSLGRNSWKPSPRPYEVVLAALGTTAAESVYVSDNPAKDFLGARLAGMRSVRLRAPEGIYAGLEPPSAEHAPDLEVSSLDDLEDALGSLAR